MSLSHVTAKTDDSPDDILHSVVTEWPGSNWRQQLRARAADGVCRLGESPRAGPCLPARARPGPGAGVLTDGVSHVHPSPVRLGAPAGCRAGQYACNYGCQAGLPDPRPGPGPEYHDTSNSWERNASAAIGPSGGGPGPRNPGRARARRVA
jgi:hypothetical protein